MKKTTVGLLIIMLIGYLIPQTTMAKSNELQTLIDETPRGETLELAEKTYEGNVVITKPITLVGEKGTVIQGDHTDNVIEIDSDDVTLENLAVTGSGKSRDSEQEHSGVRVMGDSATLKSLSITDSFHGVLLNRIDHTTIEGLTIIGASSESSFLWKRGSF